MAEIKKALLFVNPQKPAAPPLAENILAALGSYGFEGVISGSSGPVTGAEFTGAANGGLFAHVAFSLGGDGTVLYAVRAVAPRGIPVFPINIGTLGFIAVVQPPEWQKIFESWLDGRTRTSRRLMLEIVVERKGSLVFAAAGLNDGVISATGIAKLVNLKVESVDISGGAPERLPLGRYRSDGLIVATPTGSTAHSVAAGGPILDPEIEALIINPICPFTLSNRPIVVPSHETVIIDVEAEQRSSVMLTVDGQVSLPLLPEDRVLVRRSPHDALLIASPRKSFYRALQTKLSWSGGNPHA